MLDTSSVLWFFGLEHNIVHIEIDQLARCLECRWMASWLAEWLLGFWDIQGFKIRKFTKSQLGLGHWCGLTTRLAFEDGVIEVDEIDK